MEFDVTFTNKEITPWGGMAFLKQFMDKIGFREQVETCLSLPTQGSNRGHDVASLLEAFTASVWCGANRFLHTEVTRNDTALRTIFGWKNVPGQDAYKRYFNKFSQVTNAEVSQHFYSWIMSKINFNHFTLDFDSSVITRYGKQEGAKKGYNPNKRGRLSHHPLIAFVNDIRLVANMWLRSGNTSSSNNFLGFLEDTLAKCGDKKVGLIRLDSGFFQQNILQYLEEKKLNYIVAAKFNQPIQRFIHNQKGWILLDDGIELCEQQYIATTWDKPRRMVIVRQKIKERPQATGRTLSLFADDEIHHDYRYSAYITSLDFSCAEVWRLYRGRGDAENRIKELKYDFGFDSFNLKDFFATEAALTFVMIAYNLMSIFRMFVLQEKTQRTLTTLRYRVFAIGAYFTKIKGRLILNIALHKKRRHWFNGLWDYEIEFPLKFSNA
ncbi:MAG: IS1380 family transposase [Bacteroidetes bacterium]|nr:IS1380 family transposase [Bacteroidota bacterium]